MFNKNVWSLALLFSCVATNVVAMNKNGAGIPEEEYQDIQPTSLVSKYLAFARRDAVAKWHLNSKAPSLADTKTTAEQRTLYAIKDGAVATTLLTGALTAGYLAFVFTYYNNICWTNDANELVCLPASDKEKIANGACMAVGALFVCGLGYGKSCAREITAARNELYRQVLDTNHYNYLKGEHIAEVTRARPNLLPQVIEQQKKQFSHYRDMGLEVLKQ